MSKRRETLIRRVVFGAHALAVASALGLAGCDDDDDTGSADAASDAVVADAEHNPDTLDPDATTPDAADPDATALDAADPDAEPDAALPDAWTPPEACDEPLALPLEAEVLSESSNPKNYFGGDLALGQSRAAIVTRAGDLFRIGPDGKGALWARKVARTARGLAFLSTGELVIADSARGMLLKVYPGGEVRTLVPHLDAPAGLDVDHDDFIYVSEATRGAISRVHPETGALETLAVGLKITPGALAFSPDERTLYVAAQNSGTIYALTRDEAGHFGALAPLASLPGQVGPCDGQRIGDACGDGLICLDDGQGGLTCGQRGACYGRDPGDECMDDWGTSGICLDFGGTLVCGQAGACDFLEEGDACEENGRPGLCTTGGVMPVDAISRPGGLYCRPFAACEGRDNGDACGEYEGVDGVCQGVNQVATCAAGACVGQPEGAACDDGDGAGTCSLEMMEGYLLCRPFAPCEGREAGEACVQFGMDGICEGEGDGLYCTIPSPCDLLGAGEPCSAPWGDGICQDTGSGSLECIVAEPCQTGAAGDACRDWSGQEGTCADNLQGALYCQSPGACDGAMLGVECWEPATGLPGICRFSANHGLYCAAANPCAGERVGARCDWAEAGLSGFCQEGSNGLLFCRQPEPCDGLSVGDACTSWSGVGGICQDYGNPVLDCAEIQSCEWARPGQICQNANGATGTCGYNDNGEMVCQVNSCQLSGTTCTTDEGLDGHCDAQLRCMADPPCQDAAEGDACRNTRTLSDGVCVARGESLVCQPVSPCEGKDAGDACERGGESAACVQEGEALICALPLGSSGVKALNVDGCGHVYASDDATRSLWRISPDGQTVERVAALYREDITGLAWGNGAGGFDRDTLYLSGQGGADLLAIPLGLPGRPMVRPLSNDVTPDSVEEPPAIDCLNIADAPLSITELNRPRGYHDVAFDQDGFVIGFDGSSLVAVNRQDQLRPFASGFGAVEGMDWLPDGSLVVASEQGLVRIFPSGAQEVLAANVYAYGVTAGPDGKIYAGDNMSNVWRVDPETRRAEVFYTTEGLAEPWGPRTIGFDADASLMYIGTMGPDVFVLSLDESGEAVGTPRYFTTIMPDVHYVDGLAVDACGNLYFPNYESSALYRVAPDGVLSLYHQWTFESYGHGVEWGNGIGGWRNDALYLPQPYDNNTVVEVVVGVPGRPE